MDRNLISQRQIDALKLEALRAYFDFRGGRPTAEGVADKLGIPVRTVREWFGDNRNAELLDEIVPLWPNIGSARQFASEHVQEALQTMVELMRSGKSEKVRMDAAATQTGPLFDCQMALFSLDKNTGSNTSRRKHPETRRGSTDFKHTQVIFGIAGRFLAWDGQSKSPHPVRMGAASTAEPAGYFSSSRSFLAASITLTAMLPGTTA